MFLFHYSLVWWLGFSCILFLFCFYLMSSLWFLSYHAWNSISFSLLSYQSSEATRLNLDVKRWVLIVFQLFFYVDRSSLLRFCTFSILWGVGSDTWAWIEKLCIRISLINQVRFTKTNVYFLSDLVREETEAIVIAVK